MLLWLGSGSEEVSKHFRFVWCWWSSCPRLSQLPTPSSRSPSCLPWCSGTSAMGSSCPSSPSGWFCTRRTANWGKAGTRCVLDLNVYCMYLYAFMFDLNSWVPLFFSFSSWSFFSRGATSSWWWGFSRCTLGSSITTVSPNRWTYSALGGVSKPCSPMKSGSESRTKRQRENNKPNT